MSLRQSSTVIRAMCAPSKAVLLESVDQIVMALELSRRPESLRPYDTYQVGHGLVEILIDNNIVERPDMGDLLPRREEAPLDHVRTVVSAPFQAPAERFRGGRQNEDANRVGNQAADLGCALPVDFQKNVLALRAARG